MSLGAKTKSLLAAANWYLERRVNVADEVAALERQGYSVSAPALEFLERFCGLCVREPYPRCGSRTLLEVRPEGATGKLDREELLPAEEQLGEALTPVGSYQGCYALFMGTSGALYGIYDEILARFGQNWEEAVNTMCREGKVERMPDWR